MFRFSARVAVPRALPGNPPPAARIPSVFCFPPDDLVLDSDAYEHVLHFASVARAIIGHLDALPALVISDYHLLDGSTGVEAITKIREYYKLNIPAFIVSGDTSKVVKDARPLDNCTMMNKPVDHARLLSGAASRTQGGCGN